MSATMYRYEVTHPDYWPVIVEGISPPGAINEACKKWGAEWKYEAGHCGVRLLGKAAKPRCRRCHREFGEPGDVKAYCPDCERAMEIQRIQARRVRTTDRRAGKRE